MLQGDTMFRVYTLRGRGRGRVSPRSSIRKERYVVELEDRGRG